MKLNDIIISSEENKIKEHIGDIDRYYSDLEYEVLSIKNATNIFMC